MTILDTKTNLLPAAPKVDLALYRRPGVRNDGLTDLLETLLEKATG